ncbi:MAG: alcohol dehydrogenase catalytic domain-containing protein [Actinobacteria bacterium]|nr:alcohol dehydrogenase catalytic domain-containing protein [Actinomycetota bacterium]
MSTSARAAVAVEALRTELQDFSLPEIGADDGLLQVEVAGVCGTDWEIYRRESRGRGLGPLILGHENIGRIVALGERAAERWGASVGDRVAVEEFLPCGHCRFCLSGRGWLCDKTDSRGAGPFLRYGSTPTTIPPALWGGFGEYLYLHPNSLIHRLSDDLPGEQAALFVPLSNGIRWVAEVGKGGPGGSILVQGPGQHGLGCVVAAKAAGMETVIVSGLSHSPYRLEVARALGADLTIEADREDVAARVRDATGGRGADIVVDLAPGATETVEIAVDAAAKTGVVILAGSKHGRAVEGFSNDATVRKELTVRGVRGRDYASVERALDLIASRRFPLELMCTHTFGLSETDKALRLVGERWDRAAIHVNVVPAP